MDHENGPGKSLETYLPKGSHNWREKLVPFLEPSIRSKEAVEKYITLRRVMGKDFRRSAMGPEWIRIHEKPMSAEKWIVDGEHRNGSHFPVSAFTKN